MTKCSGNPGSSTAGQSLVSVLVGAGVSMAMLGGVITMIQYSQKAGQGAQGTSEFGMLVDSVRTLVSSPSSCASAFVDSSGNPVVLPLPSAAKGTVIEAQKVIVGGSSVVEKGEALNAVTVNKIELTRLKDDPSLVAVRLFAQKKAGALGKQDLQQSKPIFIRATFNASGGITACSSGTGSDGAAGGGPAWQDLSLTGTEDFNPECQHRVKMGFAADANRVWYGENSGWTYFIAVSSKFVAARPVEGQLSELYGIRSTNKDQFGWKNGSTGGFTLATNLTVQKLQRLCQDGPPASSPSVAGVQSCPQGMSLVGNPGSRSAYCIDTQRRPAALFKSATNICFSEGKKMCNHNEWSTACHQQNSRAPLAAPEGRLKSRSQILEAPAPRAIRGPAGSRRGALKRLSSSRIRISLEQVRRLLHRLSQFSHGLIEFTVGNFPAGSGWVKPLANDVGTFLLRCGQYGAVCECRHLICASASSTG